MTHYISLIFCDSRLSLCDAVNYENRQLAAEPLHCTGLGLIRPAKRSAHHDQLAWDLFEKVCYRWKISWILSSS